MVEAAPAPAPAPQVAGAPAVTAAATQAAPEAPIDLAKSAAEAAKDRVEPKGSVRRMSPTSGSLCGGTRLSIYGTGFGKSLASNRVEIGGSECKIETVSDSELVCKVPFRDHKVETGEESATELVTVHANGAPLSMATPLEFTFKAE